MKRPRNLADLLEAAAAQRPSAVAIRALRNDPLNPGGASDGSDVELRETLTSMRQKARAWGRGLVSLGVAPGDKVAIVAETRIEWLIADAAILLAGAVTVPIDTGASRSDVLWMLQDAECAVAFAASPFELERLLEGPSGQTGEYRREDGDDLPLAVRHAIVFDHERVRERPDRRGRRRLTIHDVVGANDERVLDGAALDERGRNVADVTLDQRGAALADDAIATLVYTAGTTGRPKGALLSHKALLHEIDAIDCALGLRGDDRILLALPLAYAFARVVAWVGLARGIELALPSRGLFKPRQLARLQPTIVPAVPRQLESIAASILRGLTGHGRVRRNVVDWAVSVGLESSQLRQQGVKPTGLLAARDQLATQLVHRRIHAALGGRVRLLISGGAPLSRDLAEWYHAVGFELLEGYGLTETSACATLDRPGRGKLGTVGLPLDGVEIRIADDGEILIRGPNLMSGYHRPAANQPSAFDDEGWLHSGDIGELDSDGYLCITDRKKDVLLTGGGKAVAPQNVESHLQANAYINSAMVYGDGRPYLTALLELDEPAIKRFCAERDIAYTSYGEISQHPAIYRLIERIVEERNRSLASYETIKKFAILERALTVEDGDLTPTLKLRRQALTHKYMRLLDSFYEDGF